MLHRQFLDERCKMTNPVRTMEVKCDVNNLKNDIESQENNETKFHIIPSYSQSHAPDESKQSVLCPTANKALKNETILPYIPQTGDESPIKNEDKMESIEPWTTEYVSCSSSIGTSGHRPDVDRCSMTQYAAAQWRNHIKKYLDQSVEKIHNARVIASDVKECKKGIYKETDKKQLENRDRLSTRAGVVHQWKTELERALLDITQEIELLELKRRRVKQCLSVLTIPESIAREFLHFRTTRLEPDLVRDQVEDELVKEITLCVEIRNTLVHCQAQIKELLNELNIAKNRLEFDWTDKKDAYDIETVNLGLKNDSPLILWKPGATRIPTEQSTPSSYNNFTQEALVDNETIRQRSVNLRSNVDFIIVKNIQDLRNQANSVDEALRKKIKLTEEARECLEKELIRCLNELSSTENLIEELRDSTRGLKNATKVVQTRLDNRLLRRNIENCRDLPQIGLIEEAKILGENISTLNAELKRTEDAQAGLVTARNNLEREIMVKKKSLYVDRDRGQKLRSFYPSATELSGYVAT